MPPNMSFRSKLERPLVGSTSPSPPPSCHQAFVTWSCVWRQSRNFQVRQVIIILDVSGGFFYSCGNNGRFTSPCADRGAPRVFL